MTTPLIEACARAMLASHDWTVNDAGEDVTVGWEALTPDWQEAYCKMARAVIPLVLENWRVTDLLKASKKVANGYLLDEREDESLCLDADHHKAIVRRRGLGSSAVGLRSISAA